MAFVMAQDYRICDKQSIIIVATPVLGGSKIKFVILEYIQYLKISKYSRSQFLTHLGLFKSILGIPKSRDLQTGTC